MTSPAGARHDFEEFSQGCGGRSANELGKRALENAGALQQKTHKVGPDAGPTSGL
jgi:hypothetical protein